MTAAPAALSLIDDGLATDADRLIADRFDAHASDQWHGRLAVLDVTPAGFCLVCGERTEDGTDECVRCQLLEEVRVDRRRDL